MDKPTKKCLEKHSIKLILPCSMLMIHFLLIINDTLFQLFSFLFVFCFPSVISFQFFLFYLVTFLINLLSLKGHSISFTRGKV